MLYKYNEFSFLVALFTGRQAYGMCTLGKTAEITHDFEVVEG